MVCQFIYSEEAIKLLKMPSKWSQMTATCAHSV